MVGFPAARMGDLHTCPMCMGAPLPINPPCAPTVMIGGQNAARMGDLCSCVAPIPVPVDPIIFGSPTVYICGQPAARMFDPTAKGGMIVKGLPTVLIGIVATPSPSMVGPFAVWEETLPDGTVVTHVGPNITIAGSKAFRDAVVQDLQRLQGGPTGAGLINSLNSGTHRTTIVETAGGNECGYDNPTGRFLNPDGTPGAGSDATVYYNPNRTQIGDGSEAWMTRPGAIGLGHELVHADDAGKGQQVDGSTGGTRNRERQAVGLPPYQNRPYSENGMRRDMGLPERPRY